MKTLRFAAICAAFVSMPAFAAAAIPRVAAAVPHLAYRDLGRASRMAPLSIVVSLAYRNAAELQQLIVAQNDPGSPYYRRWLTNAQFDAAFAPTTAQYAEVAQSLQAAGFRITQTFASRSAIDVTGTVGLAERYFNTRIDRVQQAHDRGVRYVNVTPAYSPANLDSLVYTVTGLHDLSLNHTHFQLTHRGEAAGNTLRRYAAAQAPIFGPVSTVTGIPGYAPLAFQRAYDFPITHDATYDGHGSKSAILIDADFLDSDISSYLSYYKIKQTGPRIQRVFIDTKTGQEPSQPGASSSDSVEATLDIESLIGTSPGTELTVYEVPSFAQASPQTVVDAFNKIASDNAVDSVNASFGACEDSDLSYDQALDHAAQQAAAKGMTFHASSGDEGAYPCVASDSASAIPAPPECITDVSIGGFVCLGTEVPASSSNVVAVGGTSLIVDANGHYAGEYGWDAGYLAGASGGGLSDVFTLPSWQRGTPNLIQRSRSVPDIAFAADPLTGLALYYGGSWNTGSNPIGGTSLSSPVFGGALAQMIQVSGGRLGLAADKLFMLLKSTGYAKGNTTYFHDVFFGSNWYYAAGPGYDNVTGIGSLDTWNVAQALKKR